MSTSAARTIPGPAAPAPVPGDFVHDSLPGRVVFGAGASTDRLPSELDRLQVDAVLTITSPSQAAEARRISASLGSRGVGVLELAHRARSAMIQAAVEAIEHSGADGLLVIGGGSTIGLAKSAAVTAEVPLVALPTTYSGAELSPVYHTGDADERLSSPAALPSAVIYDPRLTFSLSDRLTGSSAMSALANGVEALCCVQGSPLSALIAEEGIRHIAEGATDSVLHPDGLPGRSLTQFGAYLTGAAAAVTVPGLLQTVCEALVEVSGVSYADARAVVVPHYVAIQRRARPLVLAAIATALGCDDAVEGLHQLADDVGAPHSLTELGVSAAQVQTVLALCGERTSERTRKTVAQKLPGVLDAALLGF